VVENPIWVVFLILVDVVEVSLEGFFSKVFGRFRVFEVFVKEDREVEGKYELLGIARMEVDLAGGVVGGKTSLLTFI